MIATPFQLNTFNKPIGEIPADDVDGNWDGEIEDVQRWRPPAPGGAFMGPSSVVLNQASPTYVFDDDTHAVHILFGFSMERGEGNIAAFIQWRLQRRTDGGSWITIYRTRNHMPESLENTSVPFMIDFDDFPGPGTHTYRFEYAHNGTILNQPILSQTAWADFIHWRFPNKNVKFFLDDTTNWTIPI